MTMTGDRRKPTKGLQALWAGSSTLALLVLAAGGMLAATSMPAFAACNPTNPNSGDTVTCDTDPPNPETNGIIAPGSNDVTVNILPGAILQTAGGPAIDLGDNVVLDHQGIIRTTGNNAAAVLLSENGPTGGVGSTVQLYGGGTIETADDSSAGIVFGNFGAGTAKAFSMDAVDVSTLGNNSTAINLGGVGVGSVMSGSLTNVNLTTQGNNSAGLLVGGMIGDDNVFVFNMNSVSVETLGSDSAGIAIGTPGGQHSYSSFSWSLNDVTVETEGHRSTGLSIFGFGDGADTSDATLVLAQTSITTLGDDATGLLVDVIGSDLTNSTVTAIVGNLVVHTEGDRSNGIFIGNGLGANTGITGSTILVVAGSIDITTTGDDAIGLIVEPVGFGAVGSDITTTLGDIAVATSGANSHGIVLGEGLGADMSATVTNNTLTLENISSTTTGDGAAALVLHGHTLVAPTASTFSASGANAHGVLGLLGVGETTRFTVTDGTTVQATGAGGSGMRFEGSGAGASATVIVTAGHGVSGADMGLVFDTVAGDVTLAGMLTGGSGVAVQFADTDDRFELQTGGTVTGTIEGGLGTDSFVFSGTETASFDMAQVNDFEDFLKTGSSVWTLMGTNADPSTFLVNEGTLVNNATLTNMAMTVASGARLEGVGTVGGLTLNSGGTLSPGNSIGTLTVTGDATFNAGSVFIVEVEAPDQADLLSVTGTATINGGEVQVTKLSAEASYLDGQTYRIVEAGTVLNNGGFTFANPFLFLSSELEYGATYVDIVLTAAAPGQDFTTVAQTFNQFQAATGLNDLEQSGDALAVYNELLLMTDADEARRAFDLSSGEIHASGQHVIDQTFGLFSRMLRGQASAGLGGMAGGQVLTAPLAYGPSLSAGPGVLAIDDATTSAYANSRVAQAWLAPLGGRGTIDADGNAAALNWWAAGLAGGYEGPIEVASGQAYAGFGLGYIRSHGSVDARLSTFDADGFHIGAYGGWSDGPWTLAGSLAYAVNRISTERRIVFGGIDQTATADYWNHTIGFSGEALYGFDMGGGTTLSPLATLDAGWSGHGGFTERGAGALSLTGASESWTRLDTGLGFAVQHVVLTESGRVTLDGRAVWEHAFADVVPSQSLAFAGSPTGFTVNGPDAGRDRFRLGAGISFEATEDLTIRASYSGLFSGSQQNHSASLGLNVKF